MIKGAPMKTSKITHWPPIVVLKEVTYSYANHRTEKVHFQTVSSIVGQRRFYLLKKHFFWKRKRKKIGSEFQFPNL